MKKKLTRIMGIGLALVMVLSLMVVFAPVAGAADYKENDWGEWELVVPGEQVEDVWKKCIAAWKAAIRMEGGQ